MVLKPQLFNNLILLGFVFLPMQGWANAWPTFSHIVFLASIELVKRKDCLRDKSSFFETLRTGNTSTTLWQKKVFPTNLTYPIFFLHLKWWSLLQLCMGSYNCSSRNWLWIRPDELARNFEVAARYLCALQWDSRCGIHSGKPRRWRSFISGWSRVQCRRRDKKVWWSVPS